MRIALVLSNSAGLIVDAAVIGQALAHHARRLNVALEVETTKLPWQMYFRDGPVRFDRLKLSGRPDAVIFLENVLTFDPPLDPVIPTILVPNPEWITPRTERLWRLIDQVWHKSRFSYERLSMRAPDAEHHYVGFTSIDPGVSVQTYETFAHFRGKATSRHSREVLNVWRKNAHYPTLKYQFYQDGADPFEFAEWLSWNNVDVRAGKMPLGAYFQDLSASGIHLCTSASEGFGHYINEARAMSAVAVVIDAPPMNELIDVDCGVLISPASERPLRLGVRYAISETDIERCIDKVLAFAAEDLKALGANARRRFVSEREAFVERIGSRLEDLIALAK